MKHKSVSVMVITLISLGLLSACGSSDERGGVERAGHAYDYGRTDNIKTDRVQETNTADNTGLTAQDQGTSEYDVNTTREIRRRVTDQDSFSLDAKNVKIITMNGNVFLKGPVRSMSEKRKIESIAKDVAGGTRVTSEIIVVR